MATLIKTYAHEIEGARFAASRTKAQHPRYELVGSLRTAEGPPHDVRVVAIASADGWRVDELQLEAARGWLADQRLVARQVAVNFAVALEDGAAADLVATCHPALVKSIGRATLEQLAEGAPEKLSGVTVDDARSTFRHPSYELVGDQQMLAGGTLPASVSSECEKPPEQGGPV